MVAMPSPSLFAQEEEEARSPALKDLLRRSPGPLFVGKEEKYSIPELFTILTRTPVDHEQYKNIRNPGESIVDHARGYTVRTYKLGENYHTYIHTERQTGSFKVEWKDMLSKDWSTLEEAVQFHFDILNHIEKTGGLQ